MAFEKHIIYKGATKVKLILSTNVDLAVNVPGTDGIEIIYLKPDGVTTGSWSGNIYGDAVNGQVYVDFDDTINFDVAGRWTFWVKITFADGKWNKGLPVTYIVEE